MWVWVEWWKIYTLIFKNCPHTSHLFLLLAPFTVLTADLHNKNDRLEKISVEIYALCVKPILFLYLCPHRSYDIIMTISEKSKNSAETRLLDSYTWSFLHCVFRWTTTVPSHSTWVVRVSAAELLVDSNNNTSYIFTGNRAHDIHHI